MTDGEQQSWAAAHVREEMPQLDDVHEHAGLIQDPGKRQLMSFLANVHDGDITETEIYQDIVRSEATESLTEAVDEGKVSQMRFAVGLIDNREEGADAYARIAGTLKNEGTIALVLGPPGSGKTATAMDAARIWKAMTGGTIVSNIRSWEGTDVIAEDDETLKEEMQAVEGQVLAVLDETGQYLSGEGEEVKHAQKMAKTLKYIRKKTDDDDHARQGSALLVGHTRRETAADIRRLTSMVVEKPSQNDKGRLVLFQSDGGKDSLEKAATYKGITDTSETYREHESSNFRVILDGDDDGDDGPSAKEIERRKDIKTVLKAKLQGATHDAAAGPTDYKGSWAGNRYREWLRGDYHDIVAMPDDPPDHVVEDIERIA